MKMTDGKYEPNKYHDIFHCLTMIQLCYTGCLFSFTYQKAVILHFWYKIGGKIIICVGHLMNSDLK